MPSKKRGRPRAYDPDRALDAALGVFWSHGFAEATLDALTEATGMNRPSLYAAFGSKRALFERALQRFRDRMSAGAERALAEPDLRSALSALFAHAIDTYTPHPPPQLGCLVFGVASAGAAEDEQVRAFVADSIAELDHAIQARLERAIADEQLADGTDTTALAQLVAGVIHSLSLRARAGASREALLRLAQHSAEFLASPRA